MKVFIFHHHLRGGGVTRVIESQIKSLLGSGMSASNIKIICGYSKQESLIGVDVLVYKNLDYLYEDAMPHSFTEHISSIKSDIKKVISKDDIIHIHNYGLGKNPLVTLAIFELLKDGYRVLNHCHDFAEDRPDNMKFLRKIISKVGYSATEVLYPVSNFMRFAVLNRADLRRLVSYGVDESRIDFLPNPIDVSEFDETLQNKELARIQVLKALNIDSSKKIVTYPVRVIRRKNIKELILLSILFRDTIQFAVTLPPTNPNEVGEYEKWKELVLELKLPILFEVGNKIDFKQLIAASDFCITTSVMEGFGMTFIEPWLLMTPVVGRDLPDVTEDFKSSGILFPCLYSELIVPFEGKNIDFKELEFQDALEFLRKMESSDGLREKVKHANNWLISIFNKVEEVIVTRNNYRIKEKYSIKQYGKTLNGIYKKISE